MNPIIGKIFEQPNYSLIKCQVNFYNQESNFIKKGRKNAQ